MKLLFVGDVMLGRLVNQVLRDKPPEYVWGDTLPVFAGADIRICNLECVLSDRGVPWSMTPKAFHFRSDAKNVETLKRAGIQAVSLANNHALDFEYEALFDTINALDKAGIGHAGAGRYLNEASRPVLFEAGGMKIGFIAFTDNEPAWEAKEKTAGVFHVPVDLEDSRATDLFEIVRKTRKQADFVIVSAHWGPNWGYRPVARHVPFGHALIESGTDIIFGHSCHVFQGVEVELGKSILYSTGDFVDDYAVDEIERNDESFIFIVETEGPKITRLLLYPTVIRDFQARLAGSFRAGDIAVKMQRLCAEFKTRAQWRDEERYLEIAVSP